MKFLTESEPDMTLDVKYDTIVTSCCRRRSWQKISSIIKEIKKFLEEKICRTGSFIKHY